MSVEAFIDFDVREFNKIVGRTETQIKDASELSSRELGKEAVKLLKSPTRTWRHNVEFDVLVNVQGDTIEVLAGTDDKIYGFLDRGTSVRYATMSPDWQSKTRPGSLQAGTGKGRMLFVDRNRPRPGIKARDFTGNTARRIDQISEQVFNRNIKRKVR